MRTTDSMRILVHFMFFSDYGLAISQLALVPARVFLQLPDSTRCGGDCSPLLVESCVHHFFTFLGVLELQKFCSHCCLQVLPLARTAIQPTHPIEMISLVARPDTATPFVPVQGQRNLNIRMSFRFYTLARRRSGASNMSIGS